MINTLNTKSNNLQKLSKAELIDGIEKENLLNTNQYKNEVDKALHNCKIIFIYLIAIGSALLIIGFILYDIVIHWGTTILYNHFKTGINYIGAAFLGAIVSYFFSK